jgi:NDP-sugar pyrophosphorylase family protein
VALKDLEAVILCGGLGTRLRPVVPEGPKCLAPVGGRPFLEYLLCQLRSSGVRKAILCVGYRSEQMAEYFENGERWDISLTYSVERQLLGTAGALKNAESLINHSPFFALNGDSILEADLPGLVEFHRAHYAPATIALAHVPANGRYGSVRTDPQGYITEFSEKKRGANGASKAGFEGGRINGGVYVLDREIFKMISPAPPAISLEREIFPRLAGRRICGFPVDGYFVDIGVPEDYARAQQEIPRRFAPC